MGGRDGSEPKEIADARACAPAMKCEENYISSEITRELIVSTFIVLKSAHNWHTECLLDQFLSGFKPGVIDERVRTAI